VVWGASERARRPRTPSVRKGMPDPTLDEARFSSMHLDGRRRRARSLYWLLEAICDEPRGTRHTAIQEEVRLAADTLITAAATVRTRTPPGILTREPRQNSNRAELSFRWGGGLILSQESAAQRSRAGFEAEAFRVRRSINTGATAFALLHLRISLSTSLMTSPLFVARLRMDLRSHIGL
jgi:hypothetical protein